MFLSKLLKRTQGKLMIALAGLTMVFGVGAAVTNVVATQQNEVVETKADSSERGTVYIHVEDQRNGWNDNQYYGCWDNGEVKGIRLKITAAEFASGSGYTALSDVPSEAIITGESGTYATYSSADSCIYIDFVDGGWGDNVHYFNLELPWIFYNITYTYVTNVGGRAMNTTGITATAGTKYIDYLSHSGWDAGVTYFNCGHNTNGTGSNDNVDKKTAYYFDAEISTSDAIHTEDVLYWTRYDPTAVNPTVSHRTKEGWYNSYSAGSYGTKFTGPFTWHEEQYYFYGKYVYDQYAIAYKDKGNIAYSGSNLASLPSTHTYNTATALVNGVKEGYTFDGWFTNSACTGSAITSLGATDYEAGITLYAKWTVNSYTLTWNFNGGTPSGTYTTAGSVNYGTALVYPSTVTKTGYTFSTWSPSPSTMPASNLTITANFSTDTFTIAYNKNGGASGTMSNTAATYNASVTLRANGFVAQSGYTFKEWNTAANGTGYSFSPGSVSASDVNTKLYQGNGVTRTLYAIWTSGEAAAIEYAQGFNTAIFNACDYDGNTDQETLELAWGAQNSVYDNLADHVKWWLAEDRIDGDDDGHAFYEKYDDVFGRRGSGGSGWDIDDFLNRDPDPLPVGVIPGMPSGQESPLTTTLWIVLASGIVGLGAIGAAYFVSKKRKRA